MGSADEIINQLELKPHPEGGHYRETYMDNHKIGSNRQLCSIIYYLIKDNEKSHWHRVDATECWFWHAGSSLALTISKDGLNTSLIQLGSKLKSGQCLHFVVEKNWWQTAISLGNWSLVSCLVTPSFQFSGFELADKDWKPGPN